MPSCLFPTIFPGICTLSVWRFQSFTLSFGAADDIFLLEGELLTVMQQGDVAASELHKTFATATTIDNFEP